jgi:hypothetical protein
MFEKEVARTEAKAETKLIELAGAAEWAADPPPAPDEPDVQMKSLPAVDPAIYGLENEVHAAAAEGIATPSGTLPHFDTIQRAFGAHDLSAIHAHVGGSSAREMGATAFAAGDHVVFDREPDLHTAAHEAAHVVQQAQGVNLYGGVGEAGDEYERAADAVADRVVAGQSASDLLGAPVGGSASTGAVQRKPDLTRDDYTNRADGARGTAISAQLRLAAMQVNTACDEIEAAIAAPTGAMGSDGVVSSIIRPASIRANEVNKNLMPMWQDMQRMGFRDRNVREGLGILNNARARFGNVQAKIRQWASRNNSPKLEGVSSSGVERIVDFFAGTMGVQTSGANALVGKEDEKTTDTDLIKESVGQSLDAIEASTQALGMAMREADPKSAAPGMAERVLADLHLLQTSIPPNAKTSDATWTRISRIGLVLEQAWIDGQPFGLQQNGNLIMARSEMKSVQARLAAARKAK